MKAYNYHDWKVKLIQGPFQLLRELRSYNLKERVIKNVYYSGYLYDHCEGYIQIDNPFYIEFEDGDVLAIDYTDFSSVKIGMNALPDIEKELINKDFNKCIGGKIINYNISICDNIIDFTHCYGIKLAENRHSYIDGFKLRIYNERNKPRERAFWICFRNFYDYGQVYTKF